LFGEILDADQALQLGLVDQVVETGSGMAAAEKVADRIINRSARATELSKMLINAAEGEERERVLESMAGAIAAASAELQEGLQAFAEKRAPRYKDVDAD
jgi:enoyl-CoA hydratase/carnithine racemase